MRIAVASQDRKTITGHAGRCRKFWIYQADGRAVRAKRLLEPSREQSFHDSDGAAPHPLDVQALIRGGPGPGLALRLRRRGIAGLVTGDTDPDQAVAAYLEDRLEIPAPDSQHAHEHDHH